MLYICSLSMNGCNLDVPDWKIIINIALDVRPKPQIPTRALISTVVFWIVNLDDGSWPISTQWLTSVLFHPYSCLTVFSCFICQSVFVINFVYFIYYWLLLEWSLPQWVLLFSNLGALNCACVSVYECGYSISYTAWWPLILCTISLTLGPLIH